MSETRGCTDDLHDDHSGPSRETRRRAVLLPMAIGQPCPMCGEVMFANQALDLDHSIPQALGGTVGDRIVHRSCNHRAGAKLGNLIARLKKHAAEPSRAW